jgi:hypothetical protein
MENLLKKLKMKSGDRSFSWGISPDTDWKIIFISTIILIVLVSAWNFLTYLKVDSGMYLLEEGTGEATLPTLNLESLKNTVEYYETKSLRFEKIKAGENTTVPDPSI